MTLKINNNISAINAHRSLLINDRKLNRVLEKISTGLEVVRGGDGPATLVISEQLRSQIAGIKQAISNTESAISMVQTTEAALEEVSRLLIDLRRLAVHASNDAANDKLSLQADQYEVENILQALDRIATQTSFGSRKLLDGTGGVKGTAVGDGLEFLSGTIDTASSPDEGYEVRVIETATKASFLSEDIPDTGFIDEFNPEIVSVSEGGNTIEYQLRLDETAQDIVQNLNNLFVANNINVTAAVQDESKLLFTHNEFGSDKTFYVGSTSADFLSDTPGELKLVDNGFDITGSIGGYQAEGKGNVLVGAQGSPVEGLQVRYSGFPETFEEAGSLVGQLLVEQNSLIFQLGASYGELAKVDLSSTFAKDLARGIKNDSGYASIADIDLRTFQGAQDALKLVVAASNDISSLRGRLGSLQKNSLEATNNYLRNYAENITAAESSLRDADVAEKTAEVIKQQIKLQASTLASIHANNSPQTIVQLLNSIQ